jgi:hypothetical protein
MLGTAPARAQDAIDAATSLVTTPLRTVNRYLVQPVNRAIFRPTANAVSYIVNGPKQSPGRTRGVDGFGGSLNARQMATGSNIPESEKPSAYPGEYVVRNATGMVDRTAKVANNTRHRVTRAIQPY